MILKPKSCSRDMGVVKITSVYMLMEMLILISLYMKTRYCWLVFPNLVTIMVANNNVLALDQHNYSVQSTS